MTPSNNFARNPDVAWRVIGGEAVLLDNRRGEVNVLNGVGAVVWERLDGGEGAFDAALQAVVGRYQVPEEEARRDIDAFVDQLSRAGLLVRMDARMDARTDAR